ncbi:hypothetical protein KY326_00285 [Candidatus Woesearchaeota archaeon]|nr:hypothetical protein [Candidatus Woesearchaeota archaeon]
MRKLLGLIALGLGFLSGCYSYEIPEQETARISEQIKKGRLDKITLDDLFPEDHKFPELEDYFFYVLYHLERSGMNYVLDKKDLETYFQQHELTSFVPFSEIEKLVKEDGLVKMYNGSFDESIPGASMIYLAASENLHLHSRRGYKIYLQPVQGTLELKPKFLMQIMGYNFDCDIQEIQLYDEGMNVLFKCKVRIGRKTTYWDVIYHAKDGTSKQHESEPATMVRK